MSGVYGGHLLEQLFSINSIISEHKTKTVKQKAPFTKEEATFLSDIKHGRIESGDTFLSVLEHKESLVRLVRTPNKSGIILTIPKVLEIISLLSFMSVDARNDSYIWRTEQPETLCFQLLDLISFVKESGCNIIELKSTPKERDILAKMTSRTYYQSKSKLPLIFVPLLSARYETANFTKIAQTIHFDKLTRTQKTAPKIDVRLHALSTDILRSEVTFVRNGKYESLNILEV